jgi:tRNA nucleotidyltransferase/poly(A) polymerase
MSAPLEALRATLAGRPAWLVGGAVRDRLLGRPTGDLDVVVAGDARDAARALARAAGGASFPLSEAFGAWRVSGPDQDWQVDLVPLRDDDLAADLAARDFTVNAMAEPLAGGELVDRFGGREDLAARRIRMVAESALVEDPLRTLRAVRFATELGWAIEDGTAAAVRRHAQGLERVAGERIFAELARVVRHPRVREGVELLEASGVAAFVLPELVALRGIRQSVYHHLDVHDHTLAVLDAAVALQADPAGAGLGRHAAAITALLAEPLADGLTRGDGLRLAALLHDAAKPGTRVQAGGRVGFPGHDRAGAELAADVLRRWKTSERLVQYVAALTRHHLHLGFLVHEGELQPRAAWRYAQRTAPYGIEVTLLTVADRLATRGRKADEAIARHLRLADAMLEHLLALRAAGRAAPVVRGDELARELGITPGPRLGALLAQLEEDRYAGAVVTREDAVRRARELLSGGG